MSVEETKGKIKRKTKNCRGHPSFSLKDETALCRLRVSRRRPRAGARLFGCRPPARSPHRWCRGSPPRLNGLTDTPCSSHTLLYARTHQLLLSSPFYLFCFKYSIPGVIHRFRIIRKKKSKFAFCPTPLYVLKTSIQPLSKAMFMRPEAICNDESPPLWNSWSVSRQPFRLSLTATCG